MTYCPNCGSGNIYVKRQTTFGYGAIGNRNSFIAAGGTDENYQNACMNCGHTWDAKELFNALKLASGLVEQEIDLRYPKHRLFIQELSQELSSYLYLEQELQNETSSKIKAIKIESSYLCVFPIFLGILIGITGYQVIGWVVGIFLVITFIIVDLKKEQSNREIKEELEQKIKKEAEQKKEKLRYDFGKKLYGMGTKYGLISYELPPHPNQTFHRDWINQDFRL